MKALVATGQLQGARDDDYHWAIEGELVTVQEPCSPDRRDSEEPCGCSRGFAGLASARPTTTARVTELTMTFAEYVQALREGLSRQGWDPTAAGPLAAELRTLVVGLPVGTIIERSSDVFRVRAYLSHG